MAENEHIKTQVWLLTLYESEMAPNTEVSSDDEW